MLQNMFRGCTKIFLHIIFEAWIFVAYNIQQNQTDLNLLHVTGNKFSAKYVAKQNCFTMGDAETFSYDL